MQLSLVVLVPILLWVLFIVWDRRSKKRGEEELNKIIQPPLTAEETGYIAHYCRIWHFLSEQEKRQLGKLCRQFLHEAHFEPCGGLSGVSLEMKWAVAANACILILPGVQPFYNGLMSLLLYPDDFIPEQVSSIGLLEEADPAIGESTENGNIILSWPDVDDCGVSPFEHTNVVLHEFAHFLDVFVRQNLHLYSESGLLDPSDHFGLISESLKPFWLKFRETGAGCLDEYAGTNPSEFFAVATEFYFELPGEFARDYPELYQKMKALYGELAYMKKGSAPHLRAN